MSESSTVGPPPRVTLPSCALRLLNPPHLAITWMLRQDRQSGTITRKQEEEKEGGGAEGRHYRERVQGKVGKGGLQVSPQSSWDTQTTETEVLLLSKYEKRQRQREKRNRTLGKYGEEGSCSISLLSSSKLFLTVFLQGSWRGNAVISSQNTVLLRSSTVFCPNIENERH